MIGQTITVLTYAPGGRDSDGDPIDSAVDETDVAGCAIAPRFSGGFEGSGEVDQRGHNGVIVGYTVYAPPGTVITHANKVRWRDVLYRVDGEPGTWHDPYGGRDVGVQFAMERASG